LVLLIGYGNPGRGDDGLGPALAARMEARALPGLRVLADFQLKVEHALAVAEADLVIFADADLSGRSAVALKEISGRRAGHLDSHDVSPETVMALAERIFSARARGFVLAIPGNDFHEMRDGLSDGAAAQLDRAEAMLLDWMAAQDARSLEGPV